MSTVPAEAALPPNMVVRNMLEDMLGRDVKVAPSDPWAPTLRDPGAIAVYVDDGIRLRALISCNLELSIALSAAIGLIPAKTAAGCLEEGRLTTDMAENLNEVLNIMASLFNPPDGPHVKLYALHVPGTPPPADLSEQLKMFGKREDLKIEVAGYGGGRLSLVLV
jgi:hypothetical protein